MAVFCTSCTACFPVTWFRYFLNDPEMVSSTPVTTGITFVFTFHMHYISVYKFLYFRTSASFMTTFLYPEIATSINIHALSSLSRIVMPGSL
jgi:hypothetical protein